MSPHDRKKDSAEKTINSAADSMQDKSVQNDSVQKEIFYASKEKLLTAIRDYIAEFLEDYGESDEYKEYEDYYENEYYRDYEDAERELTTPIAPRFRSKAPASRAGFEVASIPDGESYLARPEASALSAELEKLVATLDESFSEMLTRKLIDSKMTNAELARRANVDRKLVTKICSNRRYKTTKPTALALAVAPELSLDETRELLMKAGFALSRSYKFDLIVEFFIENEYYCDGEKYDVYEINRVLKYFDQPLLGTPLRD